MRQAPPIVLGGKVSAGGCHLDNGFVPIYLPGAPKPLKPRNGSPFFRSRGKHIYASFFFAEKLGETPTIIITRWIA